MSSEAWTFDWYWSSAVYFLKFPDFFSLFISLRKLECYNLANALNVICKMSGISWRYGVLLGSWIVLCSVDLVFDCHSFWNSIYRNRDFCLLLCLHTVIRNVINYVLCIFLLLCRVLEHINYYNLVTSVLIYCCFFR